MVNNENIAKYCMFSYHLKKQLFFLKKTDQNELALFRDNTYLRGGNSEDWLLWMENPFWRMREVDCHNAAGSDEDQQMALLEGRASQSSLNGQYLPSLLQLFKISNIM